MTTITVNIANTADDVQSAVRKLAGVTTANFFATYYTADYVQKGLISNTIGPVIFTDWAGARFQSITVPQGATINSAVLKTTENHTLGTATVKVYADNVDNAPTWATTSRIKNITKTAGVSVDRTAGTKSTNVTSIVQGIVNRAGWSSGNAMRFGFFQTAAVTNAQWAFQDFSKAGGTPAQLVITYTGGTTTNISAAAVAVCVPAVTKQINKSAKTTAVGVAAVTTSKFKQVIAAVIAIGIVKVTKKVSKQIAFITIGVMTLTKAITTIKKAVVTIGVTAVTKQINKSMFAAATIGVVSGSRQTNKLASITTIGVLTDTKAMSKTVACVVQTAQVVAKLFTFGANFAVTATGVATSSESFIPAPTGTTEAQALIYKGLFGGPGKSLGH